MIAPVATAADVTADKDCVFRGCFTDPNQGKNAAKWLAKNKPDAKIAIIYQSDDAYSQGICTAFTEEAKADKLNLVKPDLAFKTDTATDFKVQLGQAQDAGADLVFCPLYYTPASVILKQASDMGYKFTMMGCDGMDGLLSIKGFDTSLAEGVLRTSSPPQPTTACTPLPRPARRPVSRSTPLPRTPATSSSRPSPRSRSMA